jgi:hypothetical protein
MAEYLVVARDSFRRCLRHHPDQKDRLRRFIDRLRTDPYHAGNSLPLDTRHGIDLRGKRGAHMSHNFVIVFMICEESINRSFREKGFNRCEPCPQTPEKRLIRLGFGPHKVAYGHTWGA